ncbi:MAG TPA: hypothetical protein VF043_37170 [Ktedonobacteraceae bacterium]
MNKIQARPWRSVEELVEIGFRRSRVVMMNEVHSGFLRCIRTRRIGVKILPTAHQEGVHYLAMEALYSSFAEEVNRTRQLPRPRAASAEQESGYLDQPDMRMLIQNALDLGWTLVPYEPDALVPSHLSHNKQIEWREEMQARNLIAALATFPSDTKLLVWCGNNHHTKAIVPSRTDESDESWALMGYHFRELSGIDPFVIDQGRTVRFPDLPRRQAMENWINEIAPTLVTFGGTAGFLSEEAPACFRVLEGEDAYFISLDNEMR